MKINGVELEDLDVYDVEVAEKYDKALETVKNISEEVDIMSLSEGIRYQCNLIFDFFNTMFGEGADRKIFGNKVNLLTCLKAFEEFVEIINEQKKEIDKLANKYSPNRATRRSKK
jgi:hypothetical protein